MRVCAVVGGGYGAADEGWKSAALSGFYYVTTSGFAVATGTAATHPLGFLLVHFILKSLILCVDFSFLLCCICCPCEPAYMLGITLIIDFIVLFNMVKSDVWIKGR